MDAEEHPQPARGKFGFNQTATNARFRTRIRAGFDQLTDASRLPGPKFVVFHTLLPHDPYIYGAKGQPVTFPGKTDEDLTTNQGRTYYIHQLQYTGQEIIQAVDAIFARSGSRPVVIIQADEGFQANPEPFGEAAMQDIRVKGFGALYLPGRTDAGVPEPPNTVNTLRFVFNRYFGTHYELLRSASYPEADFPYRYEEMRVK